MSAISIIIPEATENLIENPSFEFNMNDWNVSGSVLTRVNTRSRYGTSSGRVVTNGAALNEGIYYRINPQTQGEFYAGSAYLRGAGTVRVRVRDAANGYDWVGDSITINDLRWTRLSVVGQTRGNVSNDLRLYIETAERVQAVTFYVDAAMLENKEVVSTYCDGDMENDVEPHDGDFYFKWAGPRHASTSSRSARYSRGGRIKTFEEIDVNLYPIRAGGLGMGDIRHGVVTFADQMRSVVRSWKPMPKAIYMEFWAREDSKSGYCPPASLARLHKARAELESIMKPDRSPGVQPTAFIYDLDGRRAEFQAFYESGLEFDGDLRFPWYSNFPVRMICPDPFVWEDTQEIVDLEAGSGIPNCNYLTARIDGRWILPGGIAPNGYVYTIKVSPQGEVYIGGTFTSIGGVAGTRRIARWDGDSWQPLAGGIDDGSVRDIAFGSDGMVYVAGSYDNIGGVLHDNVARYDPATDTWFTIGPGPGLGNWAYGVCVTDDGQVWFAGGFVTDNAGLNLNYVTRYDPDSNGFNALGGGPGMNGSCYDVIPDLDGINVFFCGSFTNTFGGAESAIEGVARYNRDANTFEACGTGVDVVINTSWVRRIVMTETGKLYIVGDFTHAGYVDVGNVAMFNRQEWYPLGQEDDGFIGAAAGVVDVDAGPSRKGQLLFVGDFESSTGSDLSRSVTIWDGTRFGHLDLHLPPDEKGVSCCYRGDEIWIGHYRAGTVQSAYVTTVNNTGKANAKPVLEILGPAIVQWIENQTTGEVIKIDCEVLPGERVTFDFREGLEKVWSTIKGNIQGTVLPQSDSISLIPGENVIAFFAEETDSNTEITLRWQVRHWGFDGVA